LYRENEVAIILASFNGEKFIKKQLDSLFKQSFDEFDLYIRDDGSVDNTADILVSYQKDRKNIFLFFNKSKKHGQLANFSYLYDIVRKQKKYKYIMFCDQDDVWFPEKIKKSLKEIKKHEDEPWLVCSNFYNFNMETKRKNLAYKNNYSTNFSTIIVQNWLYGCTMILNSKLIDLVKYIPKSAENHDYWFALVVSLLNKFSYIDEPLLIHRLHNNNVTAKSNSHNFLNRLERLKNETLNSEYRNERVSSWLHICKELDEVFKGNEYYSDIKCRIYSFENVISNGGIRGIRNALAKKNKGITLKQTINFYLLIFLVRRLN
jgi:rhamnosyltransferase